MLGPTLHDALLSAAAEPLPGGGLLVTAVLLVLVAFGVPLFVVIGGFAVACFLAWPEYSNTFESFQGFANNFNLIERMVELAEQPTMVAIPFFMIAGAIMSRGAIAKRLVAFANALFGWLPGGLALSTIAACMFFAAISGSSPVTVITIGAIMLPAMVQGGYGERLSLGLVTTAGTLGIIIPPSIPMIVYAIFATSAGEVVNIEDLFIAGIGPGLLIGALLAGYCLIRGRGIPRDSFSLKRVGATLLDGIWALFLPLFILGGIYLGVFNATEASAISVVLALGIELWIHRSLTLSDLPGILAETAVLMGSILVIVCVAFGFSEFMAIKEVPDAIVAWLAGFELTPFTFIVLLNILLLVVGCLMDIISAIILFVPLVAPIAGQLGFDPIHVGLIFIVNLEIGYLTPPLGLNLFVATTYFGKSFGLVIRSVLPFLLLLVLSLAIVTWVPSVSLGINNLRNDRPFWTPFPSGTVLRPVEALDEEELLAPEQPLPGDPGATPDAGEGGGSVQDLMNDPEYRKLMEEMGAKPGAEEDVEEELPPEDEVPEDEGGGGASIQDLMKDPEYRKLMDSMGEETP
jgi:C4-dicarboxylate transporter DctM subunit